MEFSCFNLVENVLIFGRNFYVDLKIFLIIWISLFIREIKIEIYSN